MEPPTAPTRPARLPALTRPGAVLTPVVLALTGPFALTVWASQLESWGDDEAALLLLAAGGVCVVALIPLGAAAGALAARLEGLTDPSLPGRADWVRLAAARAGWLAGAGVLPWVPLHLLGMLGGLAAEQHLLAALAAAAVSGPLTALLVLDRRVRRRLAGREPGSGSGSRLDRIPSALWIGGLSAILLGGPGLAAGAVAVGEPDARPVVLVGWAFVTLVAVALAAALRAFLPGIPGDRVAASARVGAAVLVAGWVWPYFVGVAGGAWMFGSHDVHGGRLVVACVSAAVLLAGVALVSWSREARGAAAR